MIIDTKAKLVTLQDGERLTYLALEGLKFLYPGDGWHVRVVPAPDTAPLVNVTAARSILSDRGDEVYTVCKLDNGNFACSCPDFQHRQSHVDGWCKHIHRAISGFGLIDAPAPM